jgi:hypothetical protein
MFSQIHCSFHKLSANSADFRVFKKFMFLSLVKCILADFSEFCKMRLIRLPPNFLFPPNFQTLIINQRLASTTRKNE